LQDRDGCIIGRNEAAMRQGYAALLGFLRRNFRLDAAGGAANADTPAP